MAVGPVDVVIMQFPNDGLRGELATILSDLVGANTIRILDLVIASKDESGAVRVLEVDDLDDEIRAQFSEVEGEYDSLLSDSDVVQAAEELDPGITAVLVAWENTWLAQMREDLQAAGGQLVAHERIPADVVEAAMADLEELAAAQPQTT